jgi:hypothetical protein
LTRQARVEFYTTGKYIVHVLRVKASDHQPGKAGGYLASNRSSLKPHRYNAGHFRNRMIAENVARTAGYELVV